MKHLPCFAVYDRKNTAATTSRNQRLAAKSSKLFRLTALLLIVAFCILSPAKSFGQWSFTAQMKLSGNCGSDIPSLPAISIPSVIPTKQECEMYRNMFLSIRENGGGGCTAYYSCTPCVGRDISIGDPTGGGSTAGGDSGWGHQWSSDTGHANFSPSLSQEVSSWGDDLTAKADAFSKDISGTAVQTTDADYNNQYIEQMRSLITGGDQIAASARFSNSGRGRVVIDLSKSLSKFDYTPDPVQIDNYVNEWKPEFERYYENMDVYHNVGQFLAQLYKDKTGVDIDAVLLRDPLSDDDKKAIRDYNEFAQKASDTMLKDLDEKKRAIDKKELDMAILAKDSYHPGSEALSNTDWKLAMDINNIENDYIRNIVNELNKYNNENGFLAVLYQNELTGAYTLSFRGTDNISGVITDGTQLIGMSSQYEYAANIGRKIEDCLKNSDVEINIVGHSLGGGLATVAGLISGNSENTYTYNQADLSVVTISSNQINTDNIQNINAYHTTTDLVTNLQTVGRVVLAPPTYGLVEDSSILTTNDNKQSIGTAGVLSPFEAHKMIYMQQHFEKKYESKQQQWSKYNGIKSTIKQQQSNPDIMKKRRKFYPQFE